MAGLASHIAKRSSSSMGKRAVSGGNVPKTVGKLLGGFASTNEWENVTGQTLSLGDAILPGLNMVKFSQVASRTAVTTRKSFANYNMQEVGAVAFLTDLGDDYDKQSCASVSMQTLLNSGGTIYTIASKTGLAVDTGSPLTKRTGKFWTSGKPTQQAVLDAGVGNHRFQIVSSLKSGPKSGDISFGRVYSGVGGKGAHLFRFDDAKIEAYTIFFPIMQPLGIVGELFIPIAKVGTSGCLTWAMILEMAAAGWSIQINGTTDDVTMPSRATVQACIAELNAQADAVVAKGLPRPIAFCYPFGQKSSNGARIETTVTTSGDQVAVSSTSGITVGMRFICFGSPDTARVKSIETGSVTLTEPVITPVSAIEGSFIDDSGAFHGAKLYKGLLAGGWKWGWTTAGGTLFLQYGIEDEDIIQAPCNTWAQTQTLAATRAVADPGIDAKAVVAWYIHQYPGSELQAIMQYVANDVASGRSYVATTPMLERLYRNARPPLSA